MRIRTYITCLLIFAIVSAAALAGTVGTLFWRIKTAEQTSGRYSQEYQRVQTLIANSTDLLRVTDLLDSDSSGVLVITDQLIARCRQHLATLQISETYSDTDLITQISQQFEELVELATRMVTVSVSNGQNSAMPIGADARDVLSFDIDHVLPQDAPTPAIVDEELFREFDAASQRYLNLLDQLQRRASILARRDEVELSGRWSFAVAVMTSIGAVYLALLWLVRQWTTRRLVEPVQNLVEATERAMVHAEEFAIEEYTGPSEVDALSRTVSSFVGSLESRVKTRTMELEEQKLHLEAEIDDREKAEFALRESEERFRCLVEDAVDAFFLHDLNGKIIDVNQSACESLGYTQDELLKMMMHDIDANFTTAEMASPVSANHAPITILERHQRLGRHRRKDGTTFPVEVHVGPVKSGGRLMLLALARDVTERHQAEREREELNRQLFKVSRQAGMAEVATNVLHNVGNVLNSVNISASEVSRKVRALRVADLTQVSDLVNEHSERLGEFVEQDERGKLLPQFLEQTSQHMTGEQANIMDELNSLARNIEHIKRVVSTQQANAKTSGLIEELSLESLAEDALRINSERLERAGVEIIRDWDELPKIHTDRHLILQILVNVISNAKHALIASDTEDKTLIVRIITDEIRNRVRVEVIDNGSGIAPDNLTRIFQHGFTTRKDGHGFGLHSCSLAAKRLGGTLQATSEGPGKGATFALDLPLISHSNRKSA